MATKTTKKVSKVSPKVPELMSSADLRETYEMLRAAHTLLRMAYGALALLTAPEKVEQAKSFTESFDYVFRCIRAGAEKLLKQSKQAAAAEANSGAGAGVRSSN